jgi:valyl-tRNA synthetase
MEAVRSIRNIRAEMNVLPSRKARAIFIPSSSKAKQFIESGAKYFSTLANITEVTIVKDKTEIGEDTASSVIYGAEIYLPLADLIDYEKEIERLKKEKARLEDELKRVNGKLNNEKFMSKAPESVVEEEKEKLHKYLVLSPSLSSTASNAPVEAPEGTPALPYPPLSVHTSTSIVGLALESNISLAYTSVIIDMVFSFFLMNY